MVRPIEIIDAISKVQAIERLQQNARAIPEGVQQFQKDMNEKLAGMNMKTAQPSAPGDRIILHGDDQDKEPHHDDEDRDHDSFEHQEEKHEEASAHGDVKPGTPPGHIDIRI